MVVYVIIVVIIIIIIITIIILASFMRCPRPLEIENSSHPANSQDQSKYTHPDTRPRL
jgi:uncharacterized membrane protein YqiK